MFRATSPVAKALPFFLNSLRAAAQDAHERTLNQTRPFLRMLMFGKPGSGKGTLTARLVKKYDILSISTGDLVRQHIAERYELCFVLILYIFSRTPIGLQAEEIVAHGGFLPDQVMLKVVTSKLDLLHNKVRNPQSVLIY